MAILADWLWFDNRRAIANARRELARRRADEEQVAKLVQELARRDASQCQSGAGKASDSQTVAQLPESA